MKLKVLKKQNNSKSCMVCGLSNPFSYKTKFYELENNILAAVASSLNEHQSYPGRTHGGMISAVLDEVIGRCIQIADPNMWGVTGELNVRFKKPVPLGKQLKYFAKITKETSRTFVGSGFIEDEEGVIYATATATYVKLSVVNIMGAEFTDEEWFFDKTPDNTTQIDMINDKYFDTLNS